MHALNAEFTDLISGAENLNLSNPEFKVSLLNLLSGPDKPEQYLPEALTKQKDFTYLHC